MGSDVKQNPIDLHRRVVEAIHGAGFRQALGDNMAVGVQDDRVVLAFGEAVNALSMTPNQAVELSRTLKKTAKMAFEPEPAGV